MSMIQRWLLAFLAGGCLIAPEIFAQRNKSGSETLTDQIFLVSNYSDLNNYLEKESLSIQELLDNKVSGFLLRLVVDTDSANVKMILPSREEVPFSSFLQTIKKFLDNNPREVVTLFLDYNFPFFYIESELKNNHLFEHIFIQDSNKEWPTTSTMAARGKQLLCFNMQQNQDSPPGFYYLWNYAVEPYFSTVIDPEFNGTYLRGKPENPLVFFTGFNLPKDTTGLGIPFKKMHINENPFLISHLINLWTKTGKRPNFIVRNQYHSVISGVIFNLNSLSTISGNITYNLQPLSMVSWEGSTQAITSGTYAFPFLDGDDLYLKPVKPGYRFIPEMVEVKNAHTNLVQNFIALPLDLGHQLVAYYPFDTNYKDAGPNNHHGKAFGVTLEKDPDRGQVAYFNDSTFIQLPQAETLGIHNHDFTVSAWIKIAQPPTSRRDITILGSEEAIYRQGLHLQLREMKPYFGFWANDLTGNTKLPYNEWVHVVWRYTKNTGEQAIFINGRSDRISQRHPSFMGRGDIFIGKSIRMENYMNGSIDDLAIWDRPLGKEEIWKLYQEVVPIWQPSSSQRTGLFFYLVLLPALTFFSYALWKRFRKFKNKRPPELVLKKNRSEEQPIIPDKNKIRLFGPFEVIDREGNDITALFTPKVRQLFILLLLYSYKTHRGITSEDINQLLWPGHNKKNATNNRGVNMNKLRQIIGFIEGIRIENHLENWWVAIDQERLFCDYGRVMGQIKHKSLTNDPSALSSFYHLVERGPLLMDSEEPWMDDFKGHMSSEVIDILLKYSTLLSMEHDQETILKICDRIFQGDPFNEEAAEIKIKTLMKNAQVNQARYTYQWFCENYEKGLKTPFQKSFGQLIGER